MCRKLTEDDLKAIEAILANKPEPYSGYGVANSPLRSIDTI